MPLLSEYRGRNSTGTTTNAVTPGRPHRENLELDRNAPEIPPEWAMGAIRID